MIMKLDFDSYKDKVMGCWAGKNIGGVLGAPFEAIRQTNPIEFYTQDLSMGPPPNDDLDLQIIWLSAVERYGRNVNASILGDYWLSYIIPNWSEYGMGKANLRAGLMPPLSGDVDNVYKNSCGSFIRSEIWACLAPGHPDIAARYAYEDAIVDHAEEGMFGEIFFAALQSAAFVESNPKTLIKIGLSYIPEGSLMRRAIDEAIACYEKGVDFDTARKNIHNAAPGTFGIQMNKLSEIKESERDMETGAPGMDAPENVAFAVAGWLYGEGDFGDSLCKAVYCGEDTDCTGATLGATMGIIMGASGLPEKWTKPLDDKIATLCIDNTSRGIWIPETVTQLTDRVLRATPLFLGNSHCDLLRKDGYEIDCLDGESLYCNDSKDYLPMINGNQKDKHLTIRELCELSPYVVRQDYPAFSTRIDYHGSPFFSPGEPRKLTVTVINDDSMRQQQWARITLYKPESVELEGPESVLLPLNNLVGSKAEVEFSLITDYYESHRLEVIVDVSLEGRHSSGSAKITLMRR